MSNTQASIDFEQLAQEIFCHLRGDLTQRQFSEKLGFSFNQVGKWEAGVTRLKWEDFLHLCKVTQLPIENSFHQFFWIFEDEINVINTVQILEKCLALSSTSEFTDRGLVKKWLSGHLAPDFSKILRAFDTRPSMLLGWLSFFLDCNQIPSLKGHYENFLTRLESVLHDPNCVYVNAALHLRFYRESSVHDEVLLAEHAACSVKELRHTLSLLKSKDIIRFDGVKYYPCPFDFSFSALPSAKLRGLTKYTTDLAANRYRTTPILKDPLKTPNYSMSSVRVVAMSATASRKVSDLIIKFHNEVGEILKEDKLPSDNVQIILLHSFASNINHQTESSFTK
jgi:transcriptional regulator with XRE-family HTH domain